MSIEHPQKIEHPQRLTAQRVRGIWGGVTMSWSESDTFDGKQYEKNVRRTIDAKVHGIYTTGSTGEFYAIEFDEFRDMVDIQANLCGDARMPLQIGCCADATRRTIRLLEYAASKPAVGAAQVVLPYWMELSEREVLQFFADLYRACPQLPLVHYNIPRAKRFLGGKDYQRILEVCPSLIGVKYTFAGQNFSSLQDALRITPGLSYFVGESLLASAMQLGARGCYSSLVLTNPAFMLDFYAACQAGHWQQAVAMQQHVARFFSDWETLVEGLGEGLADPVGDKGLAIAAGFLEGSPRCRAPYIGWSDPAVSRVRDWLAEHYPELVFGSEQKWRMDPVAR